MEKPKRIQEHITTPEDIREFSHPIEIDGQPFVLKGAVDTLHKEMNLSVYIPDFETEIARVRTEHWMPPYELTHEGLAGYIQIDESEVEGADVCIQRIRTYTEWLPEDSRYHRSRTHVGRFLMDYALALADEHNWSVTAFPYPDGKLSSEDIQAWLIRKGFQYPPGAHELIRPRLRQGTGA